jgi:hypothetical protein
VYAFATLYVYMCVQQCKDSVVFCVVNLQMTLKPVMEQVYEKAPYSLVSAISAGLGDILTGILTKLLDNVCMALLYCSINNACKTA